MRNRFSLMVILTMLSCSLCGCEVNKQKPGQNATSDVSDMIPAELPEAGSQVDDFHTHDLGSKDDPWRDLDSNTEPPHAPKIDPVAMAIVEKPIYTYAAKTVAYSPDGKLLVAGTGKGEVHIYQITPENVPILRLLRTIKAHENWAFDVIFSTDSAKLYTAGGDNLTGVWDVSTGEQLKIYKDHTEDLHGVAVTKDGLQIMTGSDDKQVLLRDVESGEVVTLGTHDLQVTGVTLSFDEQLLVSSSRDHTVKIWDLNDRTEKLTYKGHTNHVLSATFSHDSQKVASCGYDHTIRIWNALTGEELEQFESKVWDYAAIFSLDDQQIYTGSSDGSLKLFQLGQPEPVDTVELGSDVADLSLSPDGKQLAAVTSNGEIVLFDVRVSKLKEVVKLPLPGQGEG